MGDKKADPMDVDGVLRALNKALRLQQRSVLQLTRGAGSMFGLEFQAVGERLWLFARSELEDTKLLVEKITALGGARGLVLDPLEIGRASCRERV